MTTEVLERSPLEAGEELLPGFRVRRHLRRGRPFDVYEVFCESRRCSCVAKVPQPAAAGNESVARQLRAEGTRLAALSHPHLVRAYDVLESPLPAIILETLGGATLKHLIHDRGRAIDPDGLIHLGTQLCSALGYLHRNGLLHLDLKPSNVVAESGRAKVIDLSVARPPGPGGRCGTAAYLAPEQARSEDCSAATDVWGLGATLFEAITSQTPFGGSTGGLYRQLEERLVVSSAGRDRVGAELASIVDACLEPKSVHRPTLSEVDVFFDLLARGTASALVQP